VGKVWVVRLVVAVSTLLGPEGTTLCAPGVGVGVFRMGHLRCGAGLLPGVGVGRVGCGVGGCLLRIAQWMRASLWSSC
jgi:hypothetical protein